jgi:hypothetical protein
VSTLDAPGRIEWPFDIHSPIRKELPVEMDSTAQPAGPPPEQPGRSPERSQAGVTPPLGDLHQRVNDLQRELEEIYSRLLERRRAAAGILARLPSANLRLSLDLPPPGTERHSTDQLYLQLQRSADRCVDRSASMPIGRVYCHWCASFFCEHSSPPEPRSVFGGYSPTGQPQWPELVSVLLERRHPRVDSIFGGAPSPITIVQAGGELSKDQLPIYGKGSSICRVLGQVCIGYLLFPDGLRLPQGAGVPRTPLAVTFQVVEIGAAGGALILNVLSKLPDGTPAFQAFEESWDSRLADALVTTRRDLEEISLLKVSRRRRASERRRRVLVALHHLSRNLDHIFRTRERRTQHSQERHQNRGRPASTALGDALHAAPESIYRDVEERTWVVLGPKNRVHVFNDDARHVTSVVYPGETVRARTLRGKWRKAQAEELTRFLEALRGRTR